MKEKSCFSEFTIPTYMKRISEAEKPGLVIALMLIFILFERFLIQCGLPGAIIYLLDIANMYLLIQILYNKKVERFWVWIVSYAILIIAAALVALPNYSVWGGNVVYTIIEIRNIVRFLIFFMACATFLTKDSIDKIFRILVAYFYINSIYIIYQYFTFHPEGTWMRGDLLNGFFGTATGGNTFVNALMLVVIVYLLNAWSNKEVRFLSLFVPLIISVAIAGMIELKAYFVEVAVIYVWYLIRKKKSNKEKWMNVVLIVALLVVVYAAIQYMLLEYPWFRETMSIKGILQSVTDTNGYTGEQDLNRFTGIFTISKSIFHGELGEILLGIGLGNAVSYSIGGNATVFNQLYDATHYSWFSNTYVFIQNGFFGVAIYIFIFVYMFFKKKTNKEMKFITEIIAVLAVFLFFYGEALKTDAGYFVYFALASGWIMVSKKKCVEILE